MELAESNGGSVRGSLDERYVAAVVVGWKRARRDAGTSVRDDRRVEQSRAGPEEEGGEGKGKG